MWTADKVPFACVRHGGTIQFPDGATLYPGQYVVRADGTVMNPEADGSMLVDTDGTRLLPDMSLIFTDGSRIYPDGHVDATAGSYVPAPVATPSVVRSVVRPASASAYYTPHASPAGSVTRVVPGSALASPVKLPAGASQLADGGVRYPNGIIVHPDGSKRMPDGSTMLPGGQLMYPDGREALELRDGSYRLMDGTIVMRDNSIKYKDGRIQKSDGEFEVGGDEKARGNPNEVCARQGVGLGDKHKAGTHWRYSTPQQRLSPGDGGLNLPSSRPRRCEI